MVAGELTAVGKKTENLPKVSLKAWPQSVTKKS